MGETTNREAELIDKTQEFKLRKTYPQKISGDIRNRKLGTGAVKKNQLETLGVKHIKKLCFMGTSFQFGKMKKVWRWMVVMVGQQHESTQCQRTVHIT